MQDSIWGWDKTNKVYRKILVDTEGKVMMVAVIDNLSDIGDVTIVGLANGMCIYWDSGSSTWKVKQFLPLAGGTMTGAIAMGTNKITGLGDPAAAQDAATRAYVLSRTGLYLPLAGGTMTGAIAMGTNKITGLGDPAAAQDAATRAYVLSRTGLYLPLAGGTLTGNLIIEKDDPMLILKATEASSKEWQIKEIVFSDKSWLWLYNTVDDKGLYLREDGVMENQKFHAIVDTGADAGHWPYLLLECTGAELAFWMITNDGLDLRLESTKAGALLLGTGVRIKVSWSPGADHTCTGESTVDITAGENLVFGDAVYIKSDGKAWKSDADLATTMPIFGIAVATINAEAMGEILTRGWIRDESWSLTAGGIVYASVTSGAMSTTAPVGSGDQVQVVGIAKTTTLMHFNPSYELVEIS